MLKKASNFVLGRFVPLNVFDPLHPKSNGCPEYASMRPGPLRPRFGKGRVLARLGWAGARKAFLSILTD